MSSVAQPNGKAMSSVSLQLTITFNRCIDVRSEFFPIVDNETTDCSENSQQNPLNRKSEEICSCE
jgi:hypothetical protein